MNGIRVKICGLTRDEDVRAAVAAGADAIGFINVPGGTRYLEARRIVELARLVPPFVTPVAVVDLTDPLHEEREEALRFLCTRGFRCVQFHGHEPPWEIERLKGLLGLSVIKAFRLRHARDLDLMKSYAGVVDAFLVEGGAGQGLGCDWDLAAEAVQILDSPVILAGGLSPETVAEAVDRVRPYAVDVSSGVEATPGIKDLDRVVAFVKNSRMATGSFTPGS